MNTTITESAPTTLGSADVFARVLARSQHLPKWWLDLKEQAWNRFQETPLPRRTDEKWRFARLGGLNTDRFQLPLPVSPALESRAEEATGHLAETAGSMHFLNDTLIHSRGIDKELAGRGVIWKPIEQAVLEHEDLLKKHFMAEPVELGSDRFTSLHVALCTAGSFLYVPKNVAIDLPLVAYHLVAGQEAAIFPHTLLVAEDNAQVTLVDFFFSLDRSQPNLACGVNDLHAGPGSKVVYVAAQDWSPGSLAFQFNSTVVHRDAHATSLNVHLGASQARAESHSRLRGPAAHSEMLSLTVADAKQEFDQRTLQSHQAPHTSSNLLYKNALLDDARTIFSGLIIVDPDGQKTDAYQSNRNLLLSPTAEANSLPGLEIMANDVRCTHGATSGRVEPEQLFYLQARGIPAEAARQLLVFGFFEEVLNKLENQAIHDTLRSLIENKFRSRAAAPAATE